LVISGTQADAEALREEITEILSTMGLRLSPEKTVITHIDEGLDFLGWRIQRHRKRGTDRSYVYTYPARKALRAVMGKVKTWCRWMDTNQPLEVLLLRLNQMLWGWCAHFRPGVSSATFAYLSAYTWARVIGWLRRKHRRITWKELRRRYCAGGWWPGTTERVLFNPAKVPTTRYRYRGAAIPAAWPVTG
jgi:RNA-directed DNA polymerase